MSKSNHRKQFATDDVRKCHSPAGEGCAENFRLGAGVDGLMSTAPAGYGWSRQERQQQGQEFRRAALRDDVAAVR